MVRLDELVIDPNTSALLVVDAQNDFLLDVEGMAYHEREKKLGRNDTEVMRITADEHILPFIKIARMHGLLIVFIQSGYVDKQFVDDGFGAQYPNLCIPGTKGWELYNITPNSDNERERVIPKNTYSPYNGSGKLKGFLGKNNITNTLVVGFTTDHCVETTTYESSVRGFNPTVLEDCVSTAGYKIKAKHMETLSEFAEHPEIGLVNTGNVSFKVV